MSTSREYDNTHPFERPTGLDSDSGSDSPDSASAALSNLNVTNAALGQAHLERRQAPLPVPIENKQRENGIRPPDAQYTDQLLSGPITATAAPSPPNQRIYTGQCDLACGRTGQRLFTLQCCTNKLLCAPCMLQWQAERSQTGAIHNCPFCRNTEDYDSFFNYVYNVMNGLDEATIKQELKASDIKAVEFNRTIEEILELLSDPIVLEDVGTMDFNNSKSFGTSVKSKERLDSKISRRSDMISNCVADANNSKSIAREALSTVIDKMKDAAVYNKKRKLFQIKKKLPGFKL